MCSWKGFQKPRKHDGVSLYSLYLEESGNEGQSEEDGRGSQGGSRASGGRRGGGSSGAIGGVERHGGASDVGNTNDTLSVTRTGGTSRLGSVIVGRVHDETTSDDGLEAGGLGDGHVGELVVVPHETLADVGDVGVSHVSLVVGNRGVGEIVVASGEGVKVTSSSGSTSAIIQITKLVNVNSNSVIDTNGAKGLSRGTSTRLNPVEGTVDTGSLTSRRGGELANGEEGTRTRSSSGRVTSRIVCDTDDTSSQTGTRGGNHSAIVSQVVQHNTATNDGVGAVQSNEIEDSSLLNRTTRSLPVSKITSRAGVAATVGNIEGVPVTSERSGRRQISELHHPNNKEKHNESGQYTKQRDTQRKRSGGLA